MNNITALEQEIIDVSQAYYEGNPTIPDEMFDMKLEALELLKPDSEIFTIGWGYQPVGETGQHLVYPIGSLDKVKQEELKNVHDIPFSDLEDDMLVMPKLDGGSIVLYYLKGKLWKAITRGAMLSDGTYQGIVVTDNIRHAVPESLPIKMDIAVRVEIVVTWENFFEMEGTHPRNLAVGLSRSIHKEKHLIEKLRVIALYICGYRNDYYGQLPKNRVDEHILLREWGFETPQMLRVSKKKFVDNVLKMQPKRVKDLKEVHEDFSIINKSHCCKFTYPTDGLVLIDSDSFARVVATIDKGWNRVSWTSTAFKFKEESAKTIVENITWQPTPTGRLIPVLNIEETYLSGANIRNVTANNSTWLESTKCGIGSQIEIIRANEIIPMVKNVITPSTKFNKPKRCPGCDLLLVNDGVDLKCLNNECGLKIQASMLRIFTFFFPKGIGDITMLKLIDTYELKSISDIQKLFNLTNEDLSTEFGEKTSKLIIEGLQNITKFTPSIANILYFANIPQVGMVACTNLSEIPPEEFINYVKIKEFPNTCRKMCPTILSWQAINNSEYIDRVQKLLELFSFKLKNPETKITNLEWKVCVTGDVSLPRKKWFEALKKFGVREASGVSKNTSMLVTNKTAKTGKFKKANELSIPVLSENDFYEAIAKQLNMTASEVYDTVMINS